MGDGGIPGVVCIVAGCADDVLYEMDAKIFAGMGRTGRLFPFPLIRAGGWFFFIVPDQAQIKLGV